VQLVALDAVVFDTEATGPDPARARIVQFGAVELGKGATGATFDRLVDPGVPIPPEATAIHGLSDGDVRGAPPFPAVFDAFEAFRAGRLVVGHNIGYDLAVLKRECTLAGRAFEAPPALDLRLLAEVCLPMQAGYTLDLIAARLGVPVTGRHEALGDARVTAHCLVALVPHLRERGIRTVAEAEAACARVRGALDSYRSGVWVEPVARVDRALRQIDSYPFRHRVGDVAAKPPIIVAATTTLAAAIAEMSERRISSLFVTEGEASAPVSVEAAGIVTERDAMRALHRHGAAALGTPLSVFTTKPLVAVPERDFVYRAIARMQHHRIRHLAVTGEGGVLAGALSARDLLRLRANDALILGDALAGATTVPALAAVWDGLPAVVGQLLAEDVPALQAAAVVSAEIGTLTSRAADFAEAEMRQAGAGPPPAPYAVLVLGSAGRGESLLAPDQDNALVWADGAGPEADAWFADFGARMNRILDEAGVPLCKGGVMAKNAPFRGPLATWRGRVGEWIARTRPEDLLDVDIFFDLEAVHGEARLAATLRAEAYAAAHRAPMLAKLLAGRIGTDGPPLTLFGGFRLQDGRIDLKKAVTFPVVTAARCLALRHGIAAASTQERLAALKARDIGGAEDLDRLARAHLLAVTLVLRQQIADIAAGRQPSNRVGPELMSKREAAELKACFGTLKSIGIFVQDLLFA